MAALTVVVASSEARSFCSWLGCEVKDPYGRHQVQLRNLRVGRRLSTTAMSSSSPWRDMLEHDLVFLQEIGFSSKARYGLPWSVWIQRFFGFRPGDDRGLG